MFPLQKMGPTRTARSRAVQCRGMETVLHSRTACTPLQGTMHRSLRPFLWKLITFFFKERNPSNKLNWIICTDFILPVVCCVYCKWELRILWKSFVVFFYPWPCLVSKNFGFRYYNTLVFIWQILSNHELTMIKRFISRFTNKLCN